MPAPPFGSAAQLSHHPQQAATLRRKATNREAGGLDEALASGLGLELQLVSVWTAVWATVCVAVFRVVLVSESELAWAWAWASEARRLRSPPQYSCRLG
jgi:hypothetical protein